MGILRQKCVRGYEWFLNGSNVSNISYNMSYQSYIQEIKNEGMCY
jgi:hypothetical protein